MGRYNSNPNGDYHDAIDKVYGYISGTKRRGIRY
jgi:hypothetical protein